MTTAPDYRVLGIMSGSSLDGIDLAKCAFTRSDGRWTWAVEAATTIAYPEAWRERLLRLGQGAAADLAKAHTDLGAFIGEHAQRFLAQHGRVDLVASHGHTVFHQPRSGFTTQIGCGARIAAQTGVPAVVDFRSTDVALGGQGAPLVPLGERDLFPGFSAFLNLGGIANMSFHSDAIIGYDVCICNQALNHLATEQGEAFDRDGALASSGQVNTELLGRLNATAFVRSPLPRSMGREHFGSEVLPLIHDAGIPLADRMRTTVEHIAIQVCRNHQGQGSPSLLVTGGGAHNAFLIERIRDLCPGELHLPDHRTIDFKEAIIFAYLGLLRWLGEVNTLRSVTGASRDSIGGAVYLPN